MSRLSITETRQRIAALVERCYSGNDCDDLGCPGWAVFESNSSRGIGPSGYVICRCDECFAHLPESEIVFDEDVEQLPEAQTALREAVEAESEEWFASFGRCLADVDPTTIAHAAPARTPTEQRW